MRYPSKSRSRIVSASRLTILSSCFSIEHPVQVFHRLLHPAVNRVIVILIDGNDFQILRDVIQPGLVRRFLHQLLCHDTFLRKIPVAVPCAVGLLQMDGSVSYAFLDVSQEMDAMLRIMLITALLGAALWFLILIIVFILSKKAIAPIAENIEKQRLFITNAGHEFKTPLAVIISNVDVQELHGGKTKWLENIRTQALRLSDLTKQMLTLAKMEETGTSAFTSTTFDASQVLEETIRIFQESAAIRGIRVQTDVEAGVEMHFPKDQYRQLLELLLDNAVKYGKENGFLSAALHADRKMVHLTFKNDCEALPDVDPDRLFDRFYRPDLSRNRNTGGSGIGLAVVRAIAEQGGGSAKAHFLENQVVEFAVELPRKM